MVRRVEGKGGNEEVGSGGKEKKRKVDKKRICADVG